MARSFVPAHALSWIQPATPGLTWQITHVTSLCEDVVQLSCDGVIVWQLAQNFGWLVRGTTTAPSATAPAARTRTMVVLDVQFMLPANTSQREMLHDERRHSRNVIEIEAGDVQVDRFVGHHRQQALGGNRNLPNLLANDHNFRIPLMLPPLSDDQIIRAVQKTVSDVLHLELIRHVGEHGHAALREDHHTARTGLLMAPAVLAFRIQIEPVSGMLNRGDFISGAHELRNHPFDERRLATVGFSHKTDDRHGHRDIPLSSKTAGEGRSDSLQIDSPRLRHRAIGRTPNRPG